MKVETRRRISALTLLAVYLPMLLLAGLHVHPELAVSDKCDQCVSHQPHPGHISNQGAAHHDCVLCQFQTLPGLEAQTSDVSLFIPSIRHHFPMTVQPVVCMNVGSLRSRAPPSHI